ncbi:serine hydrolase domain-containing protein [Streptomyces cyslabdanicus]|uniref:serine hydrolase domain-containing protein n=1 Tax=Streptomyces cyslabdanicus TaxID=1470456 RepID=UPI0040450155
MVTAAGVLRLAAQGGVGLDAPIQRYPPGLLTEDFQPVTVRQLLNHTSGIQAGCSRSRQASRAPPTARASSASSTAAGSPGSGPAPATATAPCSARPAT